MSNALKNSLLVIVAVIVCVATPILGSKAFAQSELLFPVARSASYTAPSLDTVFAGHPQNTVLVHETTAAPVVVVTSETTTYIEAFPTEDTFLVRSALRFPAARRAVYTAPSIETVFAGHPQNTVAVHKTATTSAVVVATETETYIEEFPTEDTFLVRSELHFPVGRRAAYAAPSIETVFSGHPQNTVLVHKTTAATTATVTSKTSTYIEAFPTEDTFLVRSALRFPIAQSVTAYTTPSVEYVYASHPFDNPHTVKVAVANKNANLTREQKKTMRKTAEFQKQIAELDQQITELKEEAADDFGYGVCGPMVQNLQRFLNQNGFMLATTGAGSPEQETSFFGPRTLAALQRFQSAYTIPVTGTADTQTRILIKHIAPNALGEITATDCVPSESTEEITQNDQNDNDQNEKDDDKSTSENFFINFFKKIVNFFKTLFQ